MRNNDEPVFHYEYISNGIKCYTPNYRVALLRSTDNTIEEYIGNTICRIIEL